VFWAQAKFVEARVREVEAIVAGGSCRDDVGLARGAGDLVEGRQKASPVSAGKVGGSDAGLVAVRRDDGLAQNVSDTGVCGQMADGRGHRLTRVSTGRR
jgi:hypothetical protein